MKKYEDLEEFPPKLSYLCALEGLNFLLCRSLEKISEEFDGLTSLKKLSMQERESLEELPLGLSNLCVLEELDLVG